jgi:hypothetical protein
MGLAPPRGLSGVEFLYGHVHSAVRRTPRVTTQAFRRFVRQELRARMLDALGLEA